MSLWKHHHNMDHLRRRAEFLMDKGRKQNAPSAASSGHKHILTEAHSMDMREGLTASPNLSDMSGAIGLNKP